MGFLTHGDPVRVELGDGWWADVRSGLSFGDLAQAQKLLATATINGDQVVSQPDVAGYQIEMVKRALISWNLTDENDGPLPISPPDKAAASLKRLPQWAFNTIYTKVAELNNERTPAQEATFQAPANDGDNAGEQPQPATSTG